MACRVSADVRKCRGLLVMTQTACEPPSTVTCTLLEASATTTAVAPSATVIELPQTELARMMAVPDVAFRLGLPAASSTTTGRPLGEVTSRNSLCAVYGVFWASRCTYRTLPPRSARFWASSRRVSDLESG
ncbi:hypothetical protein D477_000655 [Arthrobacter crystallopoietes BAB-32]|uniref:Uncharacterized protein n=1 Tax=Arthrobacter crystallopoietes BAB-32 TaxID=1246476 RepID=N1VCW2_9MICC|nr:hypothetical protein D477_000655 [Arthrobacter crystallopoietes BAB-32]